ncbi:MAG: hypothetical protein GDA56_10055 [Hormoscilla sp. GM7CHS1pb]|nr:hypothetical protein [Hormoscilla sp. GM7CHS1pb]
MASRFNWLYWGDVFSLPPEVEEMPIFQDWTSRAQAAKVTSTFWEGVWSKPVGFVARSPGSAKKELKKKRIILF